MVTEEMAFVASREDMDPEFVRSEVCKMLLVVHKSGDVTGGQGTSHHTC